MMRTFCRVASRMEPQSLPPADCCFPMPPMVISLPPTATRNGPPAPIGGSISVRMQCDRPFRRRKCCRAAVLKTGWFLFVDGVSEEVGSVGEGLEERGVERPLPLSALLFRAEEVAAVEAALPLLRGDRFGGGGAADFRAPLALCSLAFDTFPPVDTCPGVLVRFLVATEVFGRVPPPPPPPALA